MMNNLEPEHVSELFDGTTTAAVMAQSILRGYLEAVNAGRNPMHLKRGIDKAVSAAVEAIRHLSLPCGDRNTMARIGAVAADNDEAVGEMVAEALERAGKDGDIIVEESEFGETFLEVPAPGHDPEKRHDFRVKPAKGGLVVKVGASSDAEMQEKKARVEKSIHAVRAAIEEGIVAGGGVSLMRASQQIQDLQGVNDDQDAGISIVYRALQEPLRQLLRNAGDDDASIFNQVAEGRGNFGYHAEKGEFCDLVAAGIIDPARVVRIALLRAASIGDAMAGAGSVPSQAPGQPATGDGQAAGADAGVSGRRAPESEKITFSKEARAEIVRGVNIAADAVKGTLGPKGRKVLLEKRYGAPVFTRDGVKIMKKIDLNQTLENLGAKMLKEVLAGSVRSLSYTASEKERLEESASSGSVAVTEPGNTRRLEFVLEGPDARGLAIRAEGKAELVFRQIALSETTGGVVGGKKLSDLLKGEHSLGITVTPDPGLAVDGKTSKTAHFKDGVLLEQVTFSIHATMSDAGESGFHIELHRAGARLYEFKLVVQVLASDAPLPESAVRRVIDLDAGETLHAAAELTPLSRSIVLNVRFDDGGSLFINMEDFLEGEFNDSISGKTSLNQAMLGNLLNQVNQSLGAGFYDASAWTVFDGSMTNAPGNSRILAAAVERIATAGWQLYHELAQDETIQKVLEYIDSIAPGTRITVRTKDVYLPWELLYPHRFDTSFDDEDRQRWPLRPEAIWGGRYAIETIQLGEGPFHRIQKARREAPPGASINFNPTIKIAGVPDPNLARAVHQKLIDTLTGMGCSAQLNDTCANIREVLQKARAGATLIYVFCHGSAPSSVGGEELQLDANCPVQPRVIDSERTFRNGPVIFLNACHSGAFSPLSFTNFLRIFRRKQSLGLIATNFTVPINFAAHFGAEVVKAYFSTKGKSLAEILLGLRKKHLAQGNPIPLFYAVQCQVDL